MTAFFLYNLLFLGLSAYSQLGVTTADICIFITLNHEQIGTSTHESRPPSVRFNFGRGPTSPSTSHVMALFDLSRITDMKFQVRPYISVKHYAVNSRPILVHCFPLHYSNCFTIISTFMSYFSPV